MIRLDRLIRNIVLALGLVCIISGTAYKDVSAAVIVAGAILTAGAMIGMWISRGRRG